MKGILLGIIVILVLAKLFDCDSTNNQDAVQTSVLTKAEAAEVCSNNGGSLVNYQELNSDPVNVDLLKSGESIWLSDHVELSPFISSVGCYSSPELSYDTLRSKSLHECINECFYIKGYGQYIGMQQNLCYCLTKRQIEGQRLRRVNDDECTITCDYNSLDVCGSNLYISVYKILEENERNSPINRSSKGLCVYMNGTYLVYRAVLYSTSCYDAASIADGYFCVDGFNKIRATDCSFNNKSDTYCFMDDAVSRNKAYEKCLKRNGLLADHERAFSFVSRHENFKSNLSYWTSTYRTFALSEKETADKSVCLAAVKTQKLQYVSHEHSWRAVDILALEPNDCSLKKKHFCSSKETPPSTFDAFTSATPSDRIVNRNNTTNLVSTYMPTSHANTFSKADISDPTAYGFDKHPTDTFRTVTNAYTKNQHRQTIGRSNNQSVLSAISFCLSIITLILVVVIVVILYRLRKRVEMSAKLSFSNGATQHTGNFPPSHSDGIYYENEDRRSNIAIIRHETGNNPEVSHANGMDANYVNELVDKSGSNHVYEGLANERGQHTYKSLSK